MSTNPEFDGIDMGDIDLNNTFSMRMAFLDLLLEVADGNDETLMRLYEQLKKPGVVH